MRVCYDSGSGGGAHLIDIQLPTFISPWLRAIVLAPQIKFDVSHSSLHQAKVDFN